MTITDDSAEDPAIDAGGPLLGDAYGTADRQADRRLPGRGWRSLGPGLLLRRRSLLSRGGAVTGPGWRGPSVSYRPDSTAIRPLAAASFRAS